MDNSNKTKKEDNLVLRESKFREKAILDNIPDMAWLKDKQGRFIMANEQFCKACGFKLEDLVGKTDLDVWPLDLAQSYMKDDQEVIKSKKRKCVQERLSDKEGKIAWIETVKTPIFDEQDKIIGTTGIARDITKRKLMEERVEDVRAELELRVKVRTAELTSSNEELRKEMRLVEETKGKLANMGNFLNGVFNSIQDGLCVLDTEMNVLRVNPALEKWYEHNMPLVGKKCYQVYHQANKPCDFCPVLETYKTRKVAHYISPLEDKEKNIVGYFDLFSFPMFDEKKEKLIGVIEYVRDISEQKKIEIKTQQTLSLLSATLEACADGILVVDFNGKIASSNQKFIDLWNIPKELLLLNDDKKLLDFVSNQLIDPKYFVTNVQRLYDNSNAESFDVIRFKDGRVFERFSIPQKIGNKVVGRVWSFRDVTKTKDYENELKVYHEKLEILVEQRTKALETEIASRKILEIEANALHRRIEFILGATNTGLDIIDKNYNIVYVDPEWARKYGDWNEKKCYEYFMDRKSPCSKCAIEEAFKTKKIVVSEEDLAKEGNRPIQVTTIPFQNEKGDWLVAEVNVDMTQKKKLDEELLRYRNHLEQLVEERTQDLLKETARYRNSEIEKSKLNRELIKTNEKLKSVSLVDAQTGLYNYRYLQEVIEAEFHQSRRYAQNLSLIMLDVDYFKSINDVYGVAFGDLVLKQLAKQLKRMVRRYDILIRYSGEEFIIISPRLDRAIAFNMAQRLLENLNFINFGNKQHNVKLKLSLSVVSFPEDRAMSGIDLVNLANKVLNKVKESGGNRVFTTVDMKSPLKKGLEKLTKAMELKGLKSKIDKLNKQTKQGLSESIFAFAKTLELKDHYTGEHVENTVHFATEIAKELKLPTEDIELIKQAAMLHDLGKIGISENILLKKGKLSKKEFDEIKRHPQIGADIIRPIKFLHALIPFIFYHHERWDGKGYPSGIKGEDIPLGARVIAIADVYQALISDRPYHKAFSKTAAIDIIKKASGSQFDPRIVGSFFRVIAREKKPRVKA